MQFLQEKECDYFGAIRRSYREDEEEGKERNLLKMKRLTKKKYSKKNKMKRLKPIKLEIHNFRTTFWSLMLCLIHGKKNYFLMFGCLMKNFKEKNYLNKNNM